MNMFRWLFGRRSSEATPRETPLTQVPPEAFPPLPGERRHRHDVPYALPKDIMEGERLNLQHYLFRYTMKGNYAAPLDDNVVQILDIGSGTGIWGQEIAREFPGARVFGLDLEPSQAVSLSASVVAPPSNYHFIQGNVLQGLPFPDNHFDFTHQRMLFLAIPAHSWSQVIQEMARVTHPGGWIELLELGAAIIHPGPASEQLLNWARDFLARRGIDPLLAEKLPLIAQQVGLNHIQVRHLDIPLGGWDKHIGVLMEKDCLAVYGALKQGVCRHHGLPEATYDDMLHRAVKEWKSNHSMYRFYLLFAQV